MGTVADDKTSYLWRRVRTGPGEIVPRSYAQAGARRGFMTLVAHMEPRALHDLNRPPFAGIVRDAQGEAIIDMRATAVTSDWERVVDDTARSLVGPVREWGNRYHLTDTWCLEAAMMTALLFDFPKGTVRTTFETPGDAFVDLYEGKAADMPLDEFPTLTYVPDHLQRTRTVFLDHLKYPTIEHDDGWHEEDEGDLGTFDPRAETIDHAIKRMMPELETRLRRTLAQMITEDTAGDTVPVRNSPPMRDFIWTARYQVLGKSYSGIAKMEGIDRKAVTKAVRKVAGFLGLTLRDPDPGGAPVKRARCVKITPKPGTS